MKKLLFLCSFLMVANMATAQKACCKKGAKSCAKTTATVEAPTDTKVASALAEADIAAEADENIVRRVNKASGDVNYFEKKTCSTSGKVSYGEVQYCTKSKAFSSVASASAEADIEPIPTDGKAKACCKKGAKSCSKADMKAKAKTDDQ